MKRLLLFISIMLLIGFVIADPSCPIFVEEMFNVTGDGTDEGPELNNAVIFATNNSPCTIILPRNKTIIFNNSLFIYAPNITLYGNGSTLKVGDHFTTGIAAINLGVSNRVYNLHFDGNRQNNSPTTSNGWHINNSVIFENNILTNTTAYTITSYVKKDWIVRDNYFHTGAQYGISLAGNEPTACTENGTFINNTIINMEQQGVKIRCAWNSTIINNTVIIRDGTAGSSGNGISYTDGTSNNVTVINNNIMGDWYNATPAGTASGIYIDTHNHTNVKILNNIINSTERGIQTEKSYGNYLINNNTISNSRFAGIDIYATNITFTNNTINDGGIMIGTASGASNNTIKYNIIRRGNNYWRSANDGIYFWYNGSYNVFDFNTIYVDRYGFNFPGTIFGNHSNTSITNNTILAGTGCINNIIGRNTTEFNNTCNLYQRPTASFTKNITTSRTPIPFAVLFTDTSINDPTNWDWYINEVKISDEQNLTTTFTTSGTYSIKLYISNINGSSWYNSTSIYADQQTSTKIENKMADVQNIIVVGVYITVIAIVSTLVGTSLFGKSQ